MVCSEELLTLEPFQQLSRAQLEGARDCAHELKLPAGTLLIKEGNAPQGFFVLLKGRVSITQMSEGIEMPIGQHEAPAFFGELTVLTDDPELVSIRTLTDCDFCRIDCHDFLTLLHECRGFERSIFRVVQQRSRELESFIRNREKMTALGTLSAGLAHELNNPAAALVRTLRAVVPAMHELEEMNFTFGTLNVNPEDAQVWEDTRDRGYETILSQSVDTTTSNDREDELLDWLENGGVKDAWKLTEPLTAAGIETSTLEQLTETFPEEFIKYRDMCIHWLALSCDVMLMIHNGLRGAERISELVQSMKSYSYMDQGAQQFVDVHDGLEDTLKLFSYKLKHSVQVHRNYDRTLPKIRAYGSELNQVWTNLIDNAIDAMNEEGNLEISTYRDGDYIRVEITDSGIGIPPGIHSRIFEPFFTTKDMGKGSGLGLDVVSRVIRNRHQGSITVTSKPKRTCFAVCLPIKS